MQACAPPYSRSLRVRSKFRLVFTIKGWPVRRGVLLVARRWLLLVVVGAAAIACQHPTPSGQVVVEVRDDGVRLGVTGCAEGQHLAAQAKVTVSIGTASQAASGSLQFVEEGLADEEGWLRLSRKASDLLRSSDLTGPDRIDLVLHFELATDNGRTYGSQLGVPLEAVRSFLLEGDESAFLLGGKVVAERPEGVCAP